MFVYDASRLIVNIDDKFIETKILRGLPLGSTIHKVIYVSTNLWYFIVR